MNPVRIFMGLMAFVAASMGACALGQTSKDASPILSLPGVTDGIGHFVSGTWGSVRFRVSNPSDQPATGTVVAYFEDDQSLQFARRVWVPPRSTRESSMPVLPPKVEFLADSRDRKRSELKTFLMESSGSEEVISQTNDVEKVYSSPISFERRSAPVVTITDLDSPRRDDYELWLDAIGSAQIAKFKSSQLIELPFDFLPVLSETLKAAGGMIVMGDRLANDPAAMDAIRDWVNDGGSLWVMLDLVELDTVRGLLGDSLPLTQVGRIGLDTLRLERTDRTSADTPQREFERPAEMIRLVAPDSQVLHTVDGWPASFVREMGRGRIVATTLDVRAWVKDRTGSSAGDLNGRVAKNDVTAPLLEVFDQFVEPTEQSRLSAENFAPLVTARIGYSILDRFNVLTILCGYSSVLLLVGLWLRQRGRLERMLWIIPVLSAMSSIPLLLAADASRHSAPASVSLAQSIETSADRMTANVKGIAAMYQPAPWVASLSSDDFGTILPRQTGTGGKIRRLTWTDSDRSEWMNLDFPAGISSATFTYAQSFDHPLEANIRLGDRGLTGKLPAGLPDGLSDAVIATSSDRVVALQLEGQGRFQSDETGVLAPRQYIAASVLNDEQRRRGEILAQVFEVEGRATRYPQVPTVFVWADPLKMPFEFPAEMKQFGSSLMALPVRLLPPEPGERIWIPAPLLSCRAIAAPNSTGASVSFDNRKRQWQEQSRPTDTWVRFQIPSELLPLEIERVTLTIDINAPLRTVELSTGLPSGMVSISKRNEMVGQFTFSVEQTEAIQLDEAGGFLVRLAVSELNGGTSGGREVSFLERRWKVNSLDLDVHARSTSHRANSKR